MTETPLNFKCLGKPILPSELPKLPPAGMKAIWRAYAQHPEEELGKAAIVSLSVELAIEIVAICLRRIDASVTPERVGSDEDYETVLAAFAAIQAANPSIFPNVSAQAPEAPHA